MTTVNSGPEPNHSGATVTVRLSQAILQTADRLGIGLPGELVSRLQNVQRVEIELQDELWTHFCAASDDPLIGTSLGLAIEPGHLDTAGLVLMSCSDLDEALASLLDYHPIVGGGGDFDLRHEGNTCVVAYRPHYDACRQQRVEAVLACLLNMARWTTGGDFVPDRLQLAHAPLAETQRYNALLDTTVEFEADENALRFPATALQLPLIQANPSLCGHLRQLAEQTMVAMGGDSLSARIGGLLQAHPHWGKERVAAELNMSGRHLARQLDAEGTSFKLLRTALLRNLAENGLRRRQRIDEMATALGFADESAFIKAFKRWTGSTPAEYRSEHHSAPASGRSPG